MAISQSYYVKEIYDIYSSLKLFIYFVLLQLDRHEDNLDDERPPRRGGYDNMRYDNRGK